MPTEDNAATGEFLYLAVTTGPILGLSTSTPIRYLVRLRGVVPSRGVRIRGRFWELNSGRRWLDGLFERGFYNWTLMGESDLAALVLTGAIPAKALGMK